MSGPWLRPKDAAKHVGMSYKTFDAWVKREGVPCSWIGSHRRFSQPTLDKVLTAISLRRVG